MSAKSADLWITINGQRLLKSFFKGNYEPMPADGFRVAKSNGSYRTLTRMTAIDLILQRCLLDAVQGNCEEIFSDFSHAYRSMRGVNVNEYIAKFGLLEIRNKEKNISIAIITKTR